MTLGIKKKNRIPWMWVFLEDLLREVELELTLKDQREIKLEKKEKGISINS